MQACVESPTQNNTLNVKDTMQCVASPQQSPFHTPDVMKPYECSRRLVSSVIVKEEPLRAVPGPDNAVRYIEVGRDKLFFLPTH